MSGLRSFARWQTFCPKARHWFMLAALFLLVNVWGVLNWHAQRVEPLQVVYHAPQGIASVDAPLQVIFNRPMVRTEDVGKQLAKSPVTCYRPEKPGQALRFHSVWESPRMLTLRPVSPLPKAVRLEVRVAPQAQTVDGENLGQPFVFQFTTTPLQLLSLQQCQRKKSGEVYCELKFDDDVAPQQLASHLACVNERGDKIKCEVTGQRAGRAHIVSVHAKDNHKFTLELTPGLCGKSGTLGLSQIVRKEIALGEMALKWYTAETRTPATGDPYVQLYFSDSVSAEKLGAYLVVEPQVPVRLSEEYGHILVSGPFALGQTYRLSIRPGFVSENGWALAQDTSRVCEFADREPLLRLASAGQILGLDGNLAVALETVNHTSVQVKLSRIYANNLVYFVKGGDRLQELAGDFGWPLAQREIKIAGDRNTLARTVLSLREWLPQQPAGAYILQVCETQNEWRGEWRVLFITDIGITAKQAGDEILVWATSLVRGQEIEGAGVSLFTATNQKIGEAITDMNGLARIALQTQPAKDSAPYLVQVSHGDDLAVWKAGSGLWSMAPFATSGVATVSKGYRAFLYTDRGVYRPGETAHIKALLRDAQRAVPPAFPLAFTIERGDGVTLLSSVVHPDQQGSVESAWDIPADIRTGFYRAKVQLVGEKSEVGGVQFQVEDFVPERLKMSVDVPAQAYRLGDQLPVTVSANYLFGAPASNCKAEIKVFLKGKCLDMPQLAGYTVGDESREFKSFQAFQSEARLNVDGRATFQVPLSGNLKPPAVLEADVQGTVMETGGRAVTRTQSVTVYAYPVYIGMQSLDAKTIEPGQSLRFGIAAVTPTGEPHALPGVDVRVVRYVWTWHRKRDQGDWNYEYVRQEHEVCRTALSLQDGKGVYTFTPSEYGEYRVCVQDPVGGMASSLLFNTWGGDEMQAGGQEYVRLQWAKASYQPGEVAELHLRAPFDGKALVTLERERTFVSQVVEVKNRTASLSFAVKPEYLPNIYCTATVLRPATPVVNGPRRAYGVETLPVVIAERKLEVAITAPAQTLPQREVEVTVDVRSLGAPVAEAQVTLAAVDEGICQVTRFATPDPFTFFYAKEGLSVRSADMFAQLLPEEPAGEKSLELPARESRRQPASKRFRTVALWHGNLRTDANGQARVTLAIPQYVGEIRLMAVAWRGQQFGNKQAALAVKKPVMLEVSAPRFAAWGDEFMVTASIFNQSGSRQLATLSMRASNGAEVVGEDTQTSEVETNGEAVLLFRARATAGATHTTLDFCGRAGNETVSEQIYLPLRPARPPEEKHGCGTLSLGNVATLAVPHSWKADTGTLELKLSTRPNLHLARSLDYLLQYPYGCIEQTTSTSFPLLYVEDLLEAAQQKAGTDKRKASHYIEAGIRRLSLMQTSSGGLGWWPGDDSPYAWGTVYAGHFLCEAKKAGYAVPAHLLDGITRYLRSRLYEDKENIERREVEAYAYYLLASLGKVTASQVAHLENDVEKRGGLEKCLIAATFHVLGRRAAADKILANRITFVERTETGGNLHSPVRNKAIYLSVLLDAAPQSPYLQLLVPDLTSHVQNASWYTTQEVAYTLMALGKYAAQFRNPDDQRLSGEISAPGTPAFAFSGEREVKWSASQNAPTTLQITTGGQGNMFYQWVSKGLPPQDDMQPMSQGLSITRALYGEEGEEIIDATLIEQGELVWVELTIQGDQAYQNIAVENWLPSGFEAENPRLTQISDVEWFNGESLLRPQYVDVRDDRLTLFIDLPDNQPRKLYFAMRAVSPGRFYLPGTQAYCMYNPFLRCQSASDWAEIR